MLLSTKSIINEILLYYIYMNVLCTETECISDCMYILDQGIKIFHIIFLFYSQF